MVKAKIAPLSYSHDLTRPEIVENFRSRIAQNSKTKLTREEIATLTLSLVDRLVALADRGEDTQEKILELCQSEKELLEEGYPQSSINSYYFPKYTAVLKAAIAQGRIELNDRNSYERSRTNKAGVLETERRHWAFEGLKYDTDTQNALRRVTTRHNNARQDELTPVRLDRYLEAINIALAQKTPESMTAAIAALTGRRFAEVALKGKFELTEHPYQLMFDGQQKKIDPQPYRIFTLIPATDVLSLIEEYRGLESIRSLVGVADEDPLLNNLKDRTNRYLQQLLGDTEIVPILTGFKSVSLHRLRGLYGRIVIHYFCPPDQHEHRFVQRFLGHVAASSEADSANARATEHYFHYNLLDSNNSMLSTKGVKLNDEPMSDLPADTRSINLTLDLSQLNPERWLALQEFIASGNFTSAKLVELLELSNPNWGISQAFGFFCQEVATLRQQVAILEHQKLQPENDTQTSNRVSELEVTERSRGEVYREANKELQSQCDLLRSENQRLIDEIGLLQDKNTKMVQMYQNMVAAFADPSVEGSAAVTRLLSTEMDSKSQERLQSGQKKTGNEPNKRTTSVKKANLSLENVQRYIDAIKQWNREHPSAAYAITEGVLTKFFGLNRNLVLEYLKTHAGEIDTYHESIGVTKANFRGFNRNRTTALAKQDMILFVQSLTL